MKDKAKFYSILLKSTIGVVIAIMMIVLLSQYITIAKLNKNKNNLNGELQTLTSQKEQLDNEYDKINSNYDEYVSDYVRDKFDYVDKDEILINK